MASVHGAGRTRELRKLLFIPLHPETMKQVSLLELLGNEGKKCPFLSVPLSETGFVKGQVM